MVPRSRVARKTLSIIAELPVLAPSREGTSTRRSGVDSKRLTRIAANKRPSQLSRVHGPMRSRRAATNTRTTSNASTRPSKNARGLPRKRQSAAVKSTRRATTRGPTISDSTRVSILTRRRRDPRSAPRQLLTCTISAHTRRRRVASTKPT